jgi:hypothetical protein
MALKPLILRGLILSLPPDEAMHSRFFSNPLGHVRKERPSPAVRRSRRPEKAQPYPALETH